MVPSLKLSTNLMSRESGRENVVMYSWYFRMGTLSIAHIVRLLQRGSFGERGKERQTFAGHVTLRTSLYPSVTLAVSP